jgi:hypothetical protein
MQNITEAKHIILTELPRLATRAQMGTFIRQITDAPVFYILGGYKAERCGRPMCREV